MYYLQPFFAANALWQGIKDFLGSCLEGLFGLTMSMGLPSYILAMFIFTLIIKVLMQPLMNKQMRSTRRMQLLGPELEELKKRFASNPQRLNEETMKLYKANNASPTAGCLPLLIQLPIIMALYQAIGGFVPAFPEYFQLNWVGGQVLNLAEPDPTKFILPLLAGGSTFLQQFISTPNKGDRTQRMMLIMMPVMFFFFVRNFQSLLAFYWIFYSLIGAAIYWPFLKKWEKEDKAEVERRAAERAAEEDARRQKKERAAAARKKPERKPNQPGYEVREDDFTPEEGAEFLEDEEEESQDPEKQFRRWMREQGVKTKTKRVKLHPYSTEESVVELCYMENGQERTMAELREYWRKNVLAPPPAPSIGSLFGFGKKSGNPGTRTPETRGKDQPEAPAGDRQDGPPEE